LIEYWIIERGLRHSFAVRTLIDWHQAGENIDAKLPLLSTYLGHLHPPTPTASPHALSHIFGRLYMSARSAELSRLQRIMGARLAGDHQPLRPA
jgi:hypothetical protein